MSTIQNALTTVARYKTWAEITGSSKDAAIQMAIIGVSAFVERYCNRKFRRQTITQEQYSGGGSDKLVLKTAPVHSVTVLQQRAGSSDWSSDNWETIDSDQYRLKGDEGILVTHQFVSGEANYRVTYVAGYYVPSDSEYQDGTDDHLDLPFDIEMAVWLLVSSFMNRKKSQGIVSQRVRDVQITYMKAVESDQEIKSALSQYKRFAYR